MREISGVTLAAGSTPPCPGLAPWLNLSSTIFTWLAAAAEIPRADLPDNVAPVLAVVGTETALAGVVREVAHLGAPVQGADGIGRERAEAHGRDVEDRGRIGLAAVDAADRNPKGFACRGFGRDRMVHPFVATGINVVLRTKGAFVEHAFGALIDDGALVAGKWQAFLVVFKEILPQFGSDFFQQEAQVGGDRVVAQDGVLALKEIAEAHQRQAGEGGERHEVA